MIQLEPSLLLLLNQHAEKVIALISVGFFEMRGGSIECHFDADGKLRKVDKHTVFKVVDA